MIPKALYSQQVGLINAELIPFLSDTRYHCFIRQLSQFYETQSLEKDKLNFWTCKAKSASGVNPVETG